MDNSYEILDENRDHRLASDCLQIASSVLGSRDKALRLLQEGLRSGRVRAFSDHVRHGLDVGDVDLSPKPPSADRFLQTETIAFSEGELMAGFWLSVFPEQPVSGRAFWAKNIFANCSGGEPFLSRKKKGEETCSYMFLPRLTAYRVTLCWRQVQDLLVDAGYSISQISAAVDSLPSKEADKRVVYDLSLIDRYTKMASEGTLINDFGPPGVRGRKESIVQSVIKVFAEADLYPSSAQVHRWVNDMLEVERSARDKR